MRAVLINSTLANSVRPVATIGGRFSCVTRLDERQNSILEMPSALELAEELGAQTLDLSLDAKPTDFSECVNKHHIKLTAAGIDLNNLDYKNVALLQLHLSEFGCILPRAETGLSVKQQRKLVREVKRSRQLGLLPFSQC